MRDGTPQLSSFKRTLTMLEAVVDDGGASSVAEMARRLGLPVATAHRQIATLVAEDYLRPLGKGRHVAGSRLMKLAQRLDEKQLIANVAAPILHRLATRVRSTVQLGTLENEMVTYRIKTGQGASALFTKVGMQLEAYCSGMGKVLLAYLPDKDRDNYLAGGPFVPLTAKTITEPAALTAELIKVQEQGFAVDDGEIADGLFCMAVPIRNPAQQVVAAISVSQADTGNKRMADDVLLAMLRQAASAIEAEANVGTDR
ncbi:IclR family transcriptional regulator [Sphingobium estronivorans]|uniref:IclR family transcriptional regulator n=1 Tax=Sphingobium estronivorans TaxID=1577690 RepID=UPI00123A0E91|nr:IclR family transcriptional regulator [Sphingobium estronivorans]